VKDDHQNEGLHDPDWGRFGIKSPSAFQPVGDPNRWGAQVITRIVDQASPDTYTAQILQIATRDGYSRSWSLIGTLSMPTALWDAQQLGNATFSVNLEIGMGVGQTTISHAIVLCSSPGFGAAGPSVPIPATGIILDQAWFRAGPYDTLFDTSGGVNNESRAFAIVGGLIGSSISVRAHYQNHTTAPTPGVPFSSRLAIIVTPYAAGEGL
jgi:hypothetical protein